MPKQKRAIQGAGRVDLHPRELLMLLEHSG